MSFWMPFRFIFLLSFIYYSSIAIGRDLKIPCDSTEALLDNFDAHQSGDIDSALLYIDQAIVVSERCGLGLVQVRYLLIKAYFLSEKGRKSEAKQVNELALELVLLSGDSLSISKAYTNFGIILTDFSAYDSAIDMFSNSLKYIVPEKDSLELGRILTRKGIAYDQQGIYDKALVNYMDALHIFEAFHDDGEISGLYNNIAIVYKRQDDLEAAVLYYNKAREISLKSDDLNGLAICNVNIGLLEKDLSHLAISDSLLHASLHYFKSTGYDYGISLVLHNLGELRQKEGKPEEALDYYNQSQKYAMDLGYKQLDAKNSYSLAKLSYKQGKYNIALPHALHSLQLAKSQGMHEEARDANKILSEIYEALGQHGLALQYYKTYHQHEDSIYNEKKSMIINQLKTKYESNQKDQEISLLKNEQTLQEAQLNAAVKQRRFLIMLSMALIVIFALLAFLYAKTKNYNDSLQLKREAISKQKLDIEAKQLELIGKNNELMRLSQEKDDLINIVAHDLRSPLNQVKGLLSILKMEIHPIEKVNTDLYFNKIDSAIDTLRGRINKILDVELINTKNVGIKLEKIQPRDVMENIHNIFEGQAAIKGIKIHNTYNGFETAMKADYNFTLQVMENLVSNAVKFSQPGEDITLHISETSEHVRLHVIDQGPGMTKDDLSRLFNKYSKLSAKPTGDEKSIGLGLSIVKKYVESMDGKVWCESNIGKGSEFIVQFGKA